MDRATVYAGQIPREVDILNAGKFGVIGVGMLAQAALGTGTVVDGFSLVPTAPASLIATLSPGQVYQVENIDATTWSSLAADSRSIVKQGVLLDATALTFAPPTTAGYAQSFLVEVQHQDADTDAKVLPYYNAAAPSQGFSGPGGSGTAQNTNRRSIAAVQVKAGTAATAGTQQAPTPDSGWAPLFIVTLNAGQTTVTAGNISVHPSAPFIPVKLPGIPVAVQAGTWTYAVATGTNTLAAALSPAPPALVDGLTFAIKCPNANTGAATLALNGFAAAAVVRKDGAALQAGDIAAGEVVRLTYSAGVFGFVTPARSETSSSTTSTVINVINGLKIPGGTPYQFATPGSYTLAVAAGVTFGVRECRGGGGGGGGSALTGPTDTTHSPASGGGGGANAQKVATATVATVLGIVVGAGGTAGPGGGSVGPGGSGGTTSISVVSGSVTDINGNTIGAGQTLCAATGGSGGSPTAGQYGAGGVASGGDQNDPGDNGGYGITLGSTAGYLGGAGGISVGSAGSPSPNQNGAGNSSAAAGIGGNGSSASAQGGVGAPGRVTITK